MGGISIKLLQFHTSVFAPTDITATGEIKNKRLNWKCQFNIKRHLRKDSILHFCYLLQKRKYLVIYAKALKSFDVLKSCSSSFLG